MLYEKKKIIICRVVWLIVLALGITVLMLLLFPPQPKLEIVDDQGSFTASPESPNQTTCEMDLTLNRTVDWAYITVTFYDRNGERLSEDMIIFRGDQTSVSLRATVNGKATRYEIKDYGIINPNDNSDVVLFVLGTVDAVLLMGFVVSLFLSHKAYEHNGNQIVVYAGFYHHYIKINGIKTVVKNGLSYSSAPLTCTLDDGTEVQAKTSKWNNRIVLKIDGKVCGKKK